MPLLLRVSLPRISFPNTRLLGCAPFGCCVCTQSHAFTSHKVIVDLLYEECTILTGTREAYVHTQFTRLHTVCTYTHMYNTQSYKTYSRQQWQQHVLQIGGVGACEQPQQHRALEGLGLAWRGEEQELMRGKRPLVGWSVLHVMRDVWWVKELIRLKGWSKRQLARGLVLTGRTSTAKR